MTHQSATHPSTPPLPDPGPTDPHDPARPTDPRDPPGATGAADPATGTSPGSTPPPVPHRPTGVLAIANAGAGSATQGAVHRALDVLHSDGAPVQLARTASADELVDVLADLDGRRLVVMGGDGSVHAVVQALHATGALAAAGPLGIVPLGTGNDLARSLGLPLEQPAAAARVALSGRPLGMELVVEDDGDVVVNAVHAGIGVSATLRAQSMKRYLRRAAYPVGALAAGALGGPWNLRVVVDGEEVHDGRSPIAVVSLSIGRTIGGGAPISPTASPHDGLVDVGVSTSTGPVARLGYARTLLRGRHVERGDVTVHRGRDVVVEAVDGEPFAVNADGETSAPRPRFAWTTLHDAWQVQVP